MRAVCTVKLKFLVVILAHLSSVHCKIEISSGHFSQQDQCALKKLKFLVIILPYEISVHCKIDIFSHNFIQ